MSANTKSDPSRHRSSASLRTSRGRLLGSLLVAALAAASSGALTIRSLGGWNGAAIWVTAVEQFLVLASLAAVIIGRRHVHRPIAAGRVVAIVPVFEESTQSLRACIDSILGQQDVVVDAIHVVDDGSLRNPVQPFEHPRIIWHRKPNGGKRSAHHHVLTLLAEQEDQASFILTVDSDSVLDQHAVAHLLRAFSDPRITGASGVVYVSNAERNLLTRIAEVNIGSAIAVGRVTRSLVGSLETTSGALAMYRAGILLDNRDHYLGAGTFGDDRMLTLYAEMKGQVVAVTDAVAYSEMPASLRGTYRQQLRWAKSRLKLLPFTLTNLPARHVIFPLMTVLRFLVVPVLLGYMGLAMIGAPGPRVLSVAVTIAATWLAIRYATVGLYLLGRDDQSVRRRITTWLLITPAELLYSLLMLFPIQYIAVARLRDEGWGTRGNPGTSTAGDAPRAVARAGLRRLSTARAGRPATAPSRSSGRHRERVGSLVGGVLMLIGSGMLIWHGFFQSADPSRPAEGALIAGVDMNGRAVQLDIGPELPAAPHAQLPAAPHAQQPAAPHADLPAAPPARPGGAGRFDVPSAGLNVGLETMNEVGGVVTPPGFASAYWVANIGASPDSPGAGTVFIAMHSLRSGGLAPGNYLYDMATGASTIASGTGIEADGHAYVVDSTSIIPKQELPDAASVWADVPGRLVVITCLEKPDNSPASENFIITAHLDAAR